MSDKSNPKTNKKDKENHKIIFGLVGALGTDFDTEHHTTI
jgi:hypothetical protein